MATTTPVAARRAGAAAVLAALIALPGCGQSEFTYAAHKDSRTYFKVPRAWTEIDEAAIENVLRDNATSPEAIKLLDNLRWVVAYDANSGPQFDNWLEPRDKPFVFAQVRDLLTLERDSVSLDRLRNELLPITQLRQEELQGLSERPDQQLAAGRFHMISDEEVSLEGGVHGVRMTYSVRGGGETLTVQQLTLVDPKLTREWLLTVSCSASCYQEHAEEIDKIMQSFTVKEAGR